MIQKTKEHSVEITDASGQVLDASLSVGTEGGAFGLIIESKNGKGRNPDYPKALECVLERLQRTDETWVQVRLISTPVIENVDPSGVLLTFGGMPELSLVEKSPAELRQEIGSVAGREQRAVGAKGPGNPNRRILISVPSWDLHRWREVLATGVLEHPPTIYLRSSYEFDPENYGYVGWTRQAHRDHMANKIRDGDLMLIYGVGGTATPQADRLRVLGLLELQRRPIRDEERSSPAFMDRKRRDGQQDKWTFALPVSRAWRIRVRRTIDQVAPETYRPERGQPIALWCPPLTSGETRDVLALPATQVSVYGTSSLVPDACLEQPLRRSLRPSRGLAPSFQSRVSAYRDGEHYLYVARYPGNAAALLGWSGHTTDDRALVKVGYSNCPDRREQELGASLPPAAEHRWRMWLLSAPFPDGGTAKLAEDALKIRCDREFASLGGEFFLADLARLQDSFFTFLRDRGRTPPAVQDIL